tara:strand:+ start:6095 stop:6217 length:123 start_codon:yes stop_codon:yes gene_type:complete
MKHIFTPFYYVLLEKWLTGSHRLNTFDVGKGLASPKLPPS